MIRQNEANWTLDSVPRAWIAHDSDQKHEPVPGQELDADYPPTVELSADEWRELTATIDGELSASDRAAEISRRLDVLIWPEGVPDAES